MVVMDNDALKSGFLVDDDYLVALRGFKAKFGLDDVSDLALMQAFTSGRRTMPIGVDYERMEFVGDAILQTAVSLCLYNDCKLITDEVGVMSLVRAAVVRNETLIRLARDHFDLIGLMIPAGKQDKRAADVVEAILGAIYHDCGLDPALAFARGMLSWLCSHHSQCVEITSLCRLFEY